MTVEKLQIVISAKTEQVREKIDKLKKSIANIQPKKMPEVNVSTTPAQGSLKKLQSEVERTQAKISKLNEKMNSAFAQQDVIAEKYKGLPNITGMSKDQSYDYMVGQDPQMQALNTQLDALDAKMAPLKEHLAQTKAQMSEVGKAASSAAPETEKLGRAARTAGTHLQKAGRSSGFFGRVVKSTMLSMAIYAGVSFVTKSIAEGFQNMALASGQANAAMSALATNGLYLKNSFASAVYPIVQALTPAFTALSNAIADVLQKIGMFFAALNGQKTVTVAKRAQVDYAETITQSGNNALQAQQKQQAAAEKAAAAQEKAAARAGKAQEKAAAAAAKAEKIAAEKTAASQEKAAKQQTAAEARVQKAVENHQKKVDALKKSIMSFDELNILGDTKDTWTAPTVPNYEATTYNPAETAAASVPTYTYTAPAAASAVKWNGMPSPTDMFQQKPIPSKIADLANKIKQILTDLKMFLIPGMLLVLGTILCLTGHPAIGIGMIIAGVAGMAYEVAVHWGTMSAKVKMELAAMLGFIGLGMLAAGLIMMLACPAKLGLGLFLFITGAAITAAAYVIAWGASSDKVKMQLNMIMASAVAALLALGIIITLACPAKMGLGIAMIAAGAIGLVALVALNSKYASSQVKSQLTMIMAICGAAMLALGIILTLACPGARALGIGLIVAGAASLAGAVAVNWGSLKGKIKEVLADIMSIIGAASAAIGLILCLTGVGIPLGIGLILAGMALTHKAVSISKTPITDWAKGAVNGIIEIFESGVNFIISMLNHLHWDIPDWVPLVGGKSFGFAISPMHISRLANGGLATKSTLANIGEGEYQEAVLPLSDDVYAKIAQGIIKNVKDRKDAQISTGIVSIQSKVDESSFQSTEQAAAGLTENLWASADTRKKVVSDETDYASKKYQSVTASLSTSVPAFLSNMTGQTQGTSKAIQNDTNSKWNSIYTFLSGKFSGISTSAKTSFTAVKNYERTNFAQAQQDVQTKSASMCSTASEKFRSIANNANTYFGRVKSSAQSYMSGTYSVVDSNSRKTANSVSTNIGGAINGVVTGINAVLSAVGSSKSVPRVAIAHYAYGTGFHPGGPALVNDQQGSTYREAVQYPDGRTFIPQGRNVYIPNLPRGSAVMPAALTAKTFKYASGVGQFFGTSAEDMQKQLVDYIFAVKDPQKILQTAVDASTTKRPINEPWMSMEIGVVKYLTHMSADALKGLIQKFIEQSNGTVEALLRVASSQVGNTNPAAYWNFAGMQGAWCDMFVSWCLKHAGIKEGYGSYVPGTMDWYKQRNRWTDIPSPGSLIFYDWNNDRTPDHIGIVESIADGLVNTIEGNTTGPGGGTGVYRKQRHEGSSILGYAIPMFTGGAGYGANFTGSGVERWRSLATKALQMTGHYSAHNVDLLLAQMNTESSGQVNPADYKDVNYFAGHPSKGLMQVIPETFASYAMPGYNTNILDPLSNILAAIRYTWSRYGGAEGVWGQGHGYANGVGSLKWGGWKAKGGVFTAPTIVGLGDDGDEAALPLNEETYSRIADGIERNQDSSGRGISLVLNRMDKLEEAIRHMSIALYTDDRTIAESANRGNTQISKRYHRIVPR